MKNWTAAFDLFKYFFTLLIVGWSIFNFSVYFSMNQKSNEEVLGASTVNDSTSSRITFWQGMISQYPTYRDAYLEIAKLESQIGNKEEARKYIDTINLMEPNSDKVLEVRRELGF